jgi:hypothetical protein
MTTLPLNLTRARQIAATAQVLAIVFLVVIAVAIVIKAGGPIANALFNAEGSWHEAGLTVVALLPALFFYESVNRLRGSLKLYSEGEFFTAASAARVAQAGDFAVTALLAAILIVPNLTRWLSGSGGFDLRIESELIGMLAFALFVSAVGRILATAAQIKAENDSFV